MMHWIIVALLWSALGVSTAAAQPVIVVTRCNYDSAEGTGWNLSSALLAGGVIRFDCGARTRIRITFTHPIDRPVVIDGGDRITLDGESQVALFRLESGGSLTLRNLSLTGGRYNGPIRISLGNQPNRPDNLTYDGGVIQNPVGAPIIIEDTFLFGNQRAIATYGGSITLRNSRFQDNTRTALRLYSSQTLIENTHFVNNTSGILGGALYQSGGSLTIRETSSFRRNRALFSGGAIASSGGVLTIEGASFERNEAPSAGALLLTGSGSVTLQHSRFENNHAQREGGAILRRAMPDPGAGFTIVDSRFTANTADFGGAIALMADGSLPNLGRLSLRSTIFSQNTAREGAAVAGHEYGIDAVAAVFARNEAAEAGGALLLRNESPHPSRLANSLVVRNRGGAAVILANAMEVINSTIADNLGTGIINRRGILVVGRITEADYAITLSNVILSGNSGGGCAGALFVDAGHNLQFPGLDCGASIPVLYPWLDGRYAPFDWSPARFGGDSGVCASSPINGVDLFGEQRGRSGLCSVGAVEQSIDSLIPPPRDR